MRSKHRLTSRSRLALLVVVAIACLAFTGVAQASPPPDPNTVGETTLSHIELNGVLGTELTVAPSQDLKIKANWKDNGQCGGCTDYLATAFAGNSAAGCIENPGIPASAFDAGSGEVDLGPAPKAPGTYNVVSQFEEAEECGEGWNATASTGYQVIAKVTVAPQTPTDANQCKNGGWREFTDRNGTPFKNQGDCVSYVASGGRNLAG